MAKEDCLQKASSKDGNTLEVVVHIGALQWSSSEQSFGFNEVIINILLAFELKKLNKQEHDLISIEVTMNNFIREITKTKGILSKEITIGSKYIKVAFMSQVKLQHLTW